MAKFVLGQFAGQVALGLRPVVLHALLHELAIEVVVTVHGASGVTERAKPYHPWEHGQSAGAFERRSGFR